MQFTVGREPQSDIYIDHSTVSKHHATITIYYYDEIEVEDGGSTNGTYINNRKVTKAKLVKGDQIHFGDYIPVMSDFYTMLFDKYKSKKNDFSREFKEILDIFKTYQTKKDKIVNQPKGPIIFRAIMTILIISILGLYPSLIPNDSVRFLMMASIGLLSLIGSLLGPSQAHKSHQLDKLRLEYEDKLICPKCKYKLIQNNLSYYEGRKKCINEKCDAKYG